VFFEYSSVSAQKPGVIMGHCHFLENYAFGEMCTVPNQAGQGGALAVVGASVPAVTVTNSNFTSNMALTAGKVTSSNLARATSVSLGGGVSIALSTNITISKSIFYTNLAYNGAGNDISSISGQSAQQNFVHTKDTTFVAGTKATRSTQASNAANKANKVCASLQEFKNKATSIVIVSSTHSSHFARWYPFADAELETVVDGQALDDGLVTLFPVSHSWQKHLLPSTEPTAANTRHSSFTTKLESSFTPVMQDRANAVEVYANAVKRGRWMYLNTRDLSLLHVVPSARQRVNAIVNKLLRLDIWLQEQSGKISDIDANVDPAGITVIVSKSAGKKDEDSFEKLNILPHKFVGNSFDGSGSRSNSNREYFGPRISSLEILQQAFRDMLHSELDAEFARIRREASSSGATAARVNPSKNKVDTVVSDGPLGVGVVKPASSFKAALTSSASSSTSSASSYDSYNNAADALVNFHPYVVVTSGKAYFENPTFVGTYHMFFGDFPEIISHTYSDSYITNSIVTVPSNSAIFGHIVQDDLILTAVTASIEIFDSNDSLQYNISQINLFNATFQLNRNLTVTGGSFVTDSTITSVQADTSSLIPYLQGGDNHPTVTFDNVLFFGVSLQAALLATESIIQQKSNSVNISQTVVTIDSVRYLFE
jgi:hypothetical protein